MKYHPKPLQELSPAAMKQRKSILNPTRTINSNQQYIYLNPITHCFNMRYSFSLMSVTRPTWAEKYHPESLQMLSPAAMKQRKSILNPTRTFISKQQYI
ncbi:hypothetical protein [Marinoscillum furvescens]|uniref:hypothetical protein n=1 Tax=Marinoscillum furvescens TaxID=1026 RepID=UPI0011C0174C|nr:hypothetical protein [Marinoscillum furvescens]